MNKYRTVSFLAGCLLLLCACKNHQQPAATPDNTPKPDSNTNKYFPVADFLQAEIRNIDTSYLAILSTRTTGKRTDSAFLTPGEFNKVAAAFLPPDLDPDSLENNYTENTFIDKTTGYLTLTYSPKDKSRSLLRMDVLVAQGNDGTNRVKSIYMERTGEESDTPVIKKMYWQAGHNLQVITTLQPKGHAAETRQQKVVWNEAETD
ncbi:MAG TPA: hypothetical protein VHD83_14675 [Puia sp.]|nr:hypothetical protein [Puia sp.]